MRNQIAAGFAVGIVSLGASAGVLANSTVIHDPEGDAASNNLDIVSAKAGHAPGGVLKHRVTVAKKVNPNDQPPSLHIDVPGGQAEDFIVRTIASDAGPGPQRGGVFTVGGDQVGKASVTPVGDNGWRFKFREKAIGKPKRYGWAWVVSTTNGDVLDRAPDSGYVNHRL